MKSFEDIEKRMNALASNQSDTPPPMVWDKVSKVLQPKKKDRSFLYIVLLTGILGLAGGYLYFSMVNTNSSQILPNQLTTLELDKVVENESSDTLRISKASKTTQATVHLAKETIIGNVPNKRSILNLNETNVSNIKSSHLKSKNRMDNISNQNEKGINEKIVGTNSFLNLQAKALKKIVKKRKADPYSKSTDANFISERVIKKIKIPSLSGHQYGLNFIRPTLKMFLAFFITREPNIEVDKKAKTFVELNVIGGKHQFQQEEKEGYNAASDYDDQLLDRRTNVETPWYTYGVQLHYGRFLSNHFYISSGIQWVQSKSLFYQESETIQLNTDLGYPEKGTLIHRGEIRFTMTEIPLMLGYQKKIVGDYIFGVEGGVKYNFYFDAKGKRAMPYQVITRFENEENIFKTHQGLGLLGSFFISKELKPGVVWSIKPTYQTYLKSLDSENYGLNTKMHIWSLNVGIRKYL